MTAEEFLVKKYEELEEENKQLRSENRELGEAYINNSRILKKLKEIGKRYFEIKNYQVEGDDAKYYIFNQRTISEIQNIDDYEFVKLIFDLVEEDEVGE